MSSNSVLMKGGGVRNSFLQKGAAMFGALAVALIGVVSLVPPPLAQAAPTGTITQVGVGEEDPVTGAINADAIESGHIKNTTGLTNAKHTLSGKAFIINGGSSSSGDPTSTSDIGAPNGQVVYAQWKDGDGWVSPVYFVRTHDLPGEAGQGGTGTYAFQFPVVKDAFGKEHKWVAQTTQYYKVWTENAKRIHNVPNDTGNTLYPLRHGGALTAKWTAAPTAGGAFQFINFSVQRVGLWMQEMPDNGQPGTNYLSHAKPVEDTAGPVSAPAATNKVKNTVSGNVYFETGWRGGDMGTTHPQIDRYKAEGYKVYVSVLTDEGKAANAQIKDNLKDQQAKLTKEMIEAHPEYIKVTRFATTDKDGNYTIRFEPGELDRNHMFAWVEDTEGHHLPAFSAFSTPVFSRYDGSGKNWGTGNWNPAAIPGRNPAPNNIYNVNFGVSPYAGIDLTIVNFDDLNRPAKPGDTADIKLDGTLSRLKSHVEWRSGANGAKIGNDCPVTKISDAANCSFKIPETAKDGDIFTAVLVSGGSDVAADSLIVKVIPDNDGDGSDDDTSDPDTNNDGEPDNPKVTPGDDAQQNITHGVKLVDSAGAALAGMDDKGFVKSDGSRDKADAELQIDFAGKKHDISVLGVTLTDKDGNVADANAEETDNVSAWRGTKDSPVVRNFGLALFTKGTYTVGVDASQIPNWAVTKDSQLKSGGMLDVTGNTANQSVTLGYDTDNDGIADVDEKDVERYQPNGVDPKETIEGTAVTTDPITFDNVYTADAEKLSPADTDSPLKGTTFAAAPADTAGANAPAAEHYAVDPVTGAVEVKATAPVGEYAIPVKVTYPDNSEEVVLVNVTVKEAQKNAYEPAYTTVYGNPGETVNVPAPTFTDKDSKAATPEKVKYELRPGAPVDAALLQSGAIDVPIPADAQRGSEISVPVRVTYADGTFDDVTAKVIVRRDTDGDGVPDPIYPADPQPGDDRCADTPAGATVDVNGCSVAPVIGDFGPITGTVGTEIVPVPVPITNDGQHVITGCTAEGLPAGLDVVFDDKNGTCEISGNPTEAVTDQTVTVTVTHEAPAGEADNLNTAPVKKTTTATITPVPAVPPVWDDASTVPGKDVTVPNTGGKVPEGSTVEVDGPGKAVLNPDGSITVTPGADVKPGDKIVVTVKDKGGNTIDTTTVTINKVPTPPTIQLAKTGVAIGFLVVAAFALIGAGAFITRRNRTIK